MEFETGLDILTDRQRRVRVCLFVLSCVILERLEKERTIA